jgi:hypothetical protein
MIENSGFKRATAYARAFREPAASGIPLLNSYSFRNDTRLFRTGSVNAPAFMSAFMVPGARLAHPEVGP